MKITYSSGQIFKLADLGLSTSEIADQIGCSKSTVVRKLRESGKPHPRSRKTHERITKMIELTSLGLGYPQISKELGVSYSLVAKTLGDLGIKSALDRSLQIKSDNGLCKSCNNWCPLSEFRYRPKGTYGTDCRRCKSLKEREYYNNNFEQILRRKVYFITKRDPTATITASHLNDLWNIYGGKCFYTDENMEWSLGNGRRRNALTVDKIIPEAGYHNSNIVLCTDRANRCKNDADLDFMKLWMPLWYNRILENYPELVNLYQKPH